MKKKRTTALVLAMLFLFLSACAPKPAAPIEPEEAEPESMPTERVFEVSGINAPAEMELLITDKEQKIQAAALPLTAPKQARKLTYASNDEAVCTVDVFGYVHPVAAGSAEITIRCGKLAETMQVTVLQPVEAIELSKTSVTLTVGKTIEIQAVTAPENATYGTAVSWSSSDEAVATVDDAGTITAVAAGKAVVTATTENGLTAECAVTVNKKVAYSSGGSGTAGGGAGGGAAESGSSGGGGGNGGVVKSWTAAQAQQVVDAGNAYIASKGWEVGTDYQYGFAEGGTASQSNWNIERAIGYVKYTTDKQGDGGGLWIMMDMGEGNWAFYMYY